MSETKFPEIPGSHKNNVITTDGIDGQEYNAHGTSGGKNRSNTG